MAVSSTASVRTAAKLKVYEKVVKILLLSIPLSLQNLSNLRDSKQKYIKNTWYFTDLT